MRIFGVDYRAPAAGDVFTQGLVHAAQQLGIDYAHADVLDRSLDTQVDAFDPDLLLVVHGRQAATRWRGLLARYPTAVWLLDEPYETDETASWSGLYTHVFMNDSVTLDRHHNAAICPTCYDPSTHYPGDGPRPYRVGFVGQVQGSRATYLAALGDRLDLLVADVVAPGPLRRRRQRSVRPPDVAALYRQTQIVVNVFRDQHQYNREQRRATALNPRIYEATACGALVLSDWRPALDDAVPQLPTFSSPAQLVELADWYLADPVARAQRATLCRVALAGDTYAARLVTMLDVIGVRAQGAA